MLDTATCYRALQARDARFDGLFFVGVTTTGVYCRPVCPARLPREDRCQFFTDAPLAEAAGFRACFRCRPELAPGQASVDARSRLLRQAVTHIEDGFLKSGSLTELAASLNITSRHLRRVFVAELGVTPSAYVRSQRVSLAKRLLQDTGLPITEVAFLSGFKSVRRFNTVFSEQFGRPPSEVRRGRSDATLTLRLDYRPPLAWTPLLEFLGTRAFPDVEWVEGGRWFREVKRDGVRGRLIARRQGQRVLVDVPVAFAPQLPWLTRRLREVFDLDARPEVVREALSGDPRLAASFEATPGLRLPGAFDGFELAVRTVLGQRVSVKAATTLARRYSERFGRPEPVALSKLSLESLIGLGMPSARAQTLRALADIWPSLDRSRPVEELLAALQSVRGVGPWTANYLAMRWLHSPDAFPAGDLIVRRNLGVKTAPQARRAAESWRPWRAYATLHLWRST